MTIWTRLGLLDLVAEWKAAYKAAATGKSYTIGSRTLTRYDLKEITAQLDWLQSQLNALDGKSGPYMVKARYRRGTK